MLLMKELEYAEISGKEPENAFAEVLHAGYEKCKPTHCAAIPRDHYLLHLVLGGQGTLKVGSGIFRLRSHQCFFIRPEESHIYQADGTNPWEYLWLGFSGVSDQVLRDIYGVPVDATAFTPSSPARLEFHMRRILASLQSPNPLEQLYSRALAVLALGCLGEREGVMSEGRAQPDYVDEAVSYIESSFATLKNAQSVADYVGLDRSYFSKIFQERTGISVGRFIAETRMSHAKRLLVDTDYKIHVIANMVGYGNYQSFERRFTSLVNLSPTEFRNRPAGQRVKAGRFATSEAVEPLPRARAIQPLSPEGPEDNAIEFLPEPSPTPTPVDTTTLLNGGRGCPSYIRRRKRIVES